MSSLRILMYCNDIRGSGQTARTLSIAASLSKALEGCSILVLTDLSTVGRFRLAERVDYVHLPVLESKNPALPGHPFGGLNIEYENKLRLRRKIAQSAVKTFRPDVVMLDESLVQYPEEMQRLVDCIREELPAAKIIWGFSDTLGAPEWVKRQWARHGVLGVLERFADEIFIFGAPDIFDVAAKYELPAAIAAKIFYTGYLARLGMPSRKVCESAAKMNRNLPLVMLCAGGGSGDWAMLDAYLRFLERSAAGRPFQSLIVAGPAIGSHEKRRLAQRAQKLPNVMFHRFGKHTLQYVRFADLVIGAGEYNLTCEILAHHKAALAIPDAKERPDNFCRACLLNARGLIKLVAPEDYHPSALQEMIAGALFNGPRLVQKSNDEGIPLNGFAKIAERLRHLCGLSLSEQLKVAS
jgi:predicted glycosyltransferase